MNEDTKYSLIGYIVAVMLFGIFFFIASIVSAGNFITFAWVMVIEFGIVALFGFIHLYLSRRGKK